MLDDVATVAYQSLRGPLRQYRIDKQSRVLLRPVAAPERRRGDFQLMVRLCNVTPAAGVVRVGKAVSGVDFAAQVIKCGLCLVARRANIEAFSGAQLDAGRNKVQLVMAGVTVPNPQNVVLVSLEPRERDLFEPVHEFLLHRRRDGFFGGK